MPVVSGFITINTKKNLAQVIDQHRTNPHLTFGEPQGNRLPVVVTTDSIKTDRAIWNDLLAAPHVLDGAVVYADFEDMVSQ